MDEARDKAIKERHRVAVRKGLFTKLKARCSARTKVKQQCDVLQATIEVSNYVNCINSFSYVTVKLITWHLVSQVSATALNHCYSRVISQLCFKRFPTKSGNMVKLWYCNDNSLAGASYDLNHDPNCS